MNARPDTTSNPKSPQPGQGVPSDEELVGRAAAGDGSAFRELYNRYSVRLYAVVIGVVKSREEAEDVTQQTFVRIHRNLPKFAGKSRFYTWAYRIAMNLAIDSVRRQQRASFRPLSEWQERPGGDASSANSSETGIANACLEMPSDALARKELRQALSDGLAQLSAEHRGVLVLRELEDLSYEEIAEVLKIPKGTVMSRLFHARRRLRAVFEQSPQHQGRVDRAEPQHVPSPGAQGQPQKSQP